MFKKVGAILLLGSILLQTLGGSMWVLRYYFKKAQYLEHCINRDKPDLHCEGKCQLKIELKKMDCCASDVASEETPQQQVPLPSIKDYHFLPAFLVPDTWDGLATAATQTLARQSAFWFAMPPDRLLSGGVFHPPLG